MGTKTQTPFYQPLQPLINWPGIHTSLCWSPRVRYIHKRIGHSRGQKMKKTKKTTKKKRIVTLMRVALVTMAQLFFVVLGGN